MVHARWARISIFVGTLAFLACLTHDRVFRGGNDASRFAQIEALVDFGHTDIGASRYAWTVDRVTIGGKDYSNKPPAFSLIGAGLYALLERGLGLSFARHEAAVIYLLTLILVGGSTAWLCSQFHGALARHAALSERARWLATTALVAGTILTSFSTTFNNHTPAAACLFAACCAGWDGRPWCAGLWLGLTVLIDAVPGALFAPVLAVVLAESAGWRKLGGFVTSLGAAAILFVATNEWIFGYPLPSKMVPGAVDHSTRFASTVAGVLLPDDPWYLLGCLFGWHGFFSVSPVLLLGAAGILAACRSGRPLGRRSTIALAIGCASMILVHGLFVGSYGGWSYGFRYLIPIVPVLLFFAAPTMERVGKPVCHAVLALSILTALIGAYHPWPPAYEQEAHQHPEGSVVTNPVGGNLAAWAERYMPGWPLAERLGSAFISPDASVRRRYLWVFFVSKGDDEGAGLMKKPRGRGLEVDDNRSGTTR